MCFLPPYFPPIYLVKTDTLFTNIDEINPKKDNDNWNILKHWVFIMLNDRYASIRKLINVLNQLKISISILF